MLELFENLKNYYGNRKIYIYGAGMVAYYLAKYILSETEYDIAGFLVSDIKNNPKSIFEIPVIPLSDEYKDELIIIGTKENLHEEIKKNLFLIGCANVYVLKDEEFIFIRSKITDSSYETMRLILSCLKENKNIYNQMNRIYNHINYLYKKEIYDNGEFISDGKLENELTNEYCKLVEDKEEFNSKVDSLIKDLDITSKETVFQILHRFSLLSEKKVIKFTAKEKEIVKKHLDDFYTSKYKITDEWFYYNGYNLPINHFELSVFWYKLGLPMLDFPQNIQNKDVIDAGAFIGDSALIISEFTNGNIYGFEASQTNYKLMMKTIQMNNFKRLIPINMGLAEKTQEKELLISSSASCNSFIVNGVYTFDNSEYEIVKCTSLDEYVKENKLRIGLIRTDVEGSEKGLLKGAINTIIQQKPTLIISIYHSLEDFFEIKKWIDALNLGYRFKIHRPVLHHHFIAETVLIAEVPKK